MRIGLFTTDFPYKKPFVDEVPEGGAYVRSGVGEVVYHLALELEKLGHEIGIFTTSADRSDHTEEFGGITVFRYGKDLKLAETEISLKYLRGRDTPPLDIVHLHAGSPPATLAALGHIRQNRAPFVVTHHLDPDIWSGNLVRRVLLYGYSEYYLRQSFAKSDRIIALSQEVVASSPHLQPFRNRISVIPNGIDIAELETPLSKKECRRRLGLPEGGAIVLFLGNLVPRKGPHVLLASMQTVFREAPDTTLVLAGTITPFGAGLREEAKALSLEKNVVFTGTVGEETKKLLYHAADIFALPSFGEAYPLTVLEAAACGLPAVVSGLPVFRAQVCDGENGLFSKTGDPEDLGAKILRLVRAREEREKMGRNARSAVQGLDWARIAAAHEAVYREVSR
ncbi:glycosyltransferase family 4 protein [uncultured Methanofollis sp.]|uniref:glycosyltransferase family 4 protein n=1 Tax=uncultured Methanofollis sp. TaxID=262500 RepID=UPI00260234AC|nr:glycosyltransferase family 4 protein [uncultured Methanofollis sp.]